MDVILTWSSTRKDGWHCGGLMLLIRQERSLHLNSTLEYSALPVYYSKLGLKNINIHEGHNNSTQHTFSQEDQFASLIPSASETIKK